MSACLASGCPRSIYLDCQSVWSTSQLYLSVSSEDVFSLALRIIQMSLSTFQFVPILVSHVYKYSSYARLILFVSMRIYIQFSRVVKHLEIGILEYLHVSDFNTIFLIAALYKMLLRYVSRCGMGCPLPFLSNIYLSVLSLLSSDEVV